MLPKVEVRMEDPLLDSHPLGYDLVKRPIDWQARSPGPARWANARGANARGVVNVNTAYLERHGLLVVRAADCIVGRMAGAGEANNEVD